MLNYDLIASIVVRVLQLFALKKKQKLHNKVYWIIYVH